LIQRRLERNRLDRWRSTGNGDDINKEERNKRDRLKRQSENGLENWVSKGEKSEQKGSTEASPGKRRASAAKARSEKEKRDLVEQEETTNEVPIIVPTWSKNKNDSIAIS
jgi:hypothetical protein